MNIFLPRHSVKINITSEHTFFAGGTQTIISDFSRRYDYTLKSLSLEEVINLIIALTNLKVKLIYEKVQIVYFE